MKNKIIENIAKKLKGFTLVELLIVITIVVLISAIAFGSLVRSQSQQAFNNKFERVLSLISNARSLAITGKGQLDYTDFDHDKCDYQGPMVGGTCAAPDYVTPANYGVNLDEGAGKITLFADINPTATGGAKGVYNKGISHTTGDDLDLDAENMGTGFCIKVDKWNVGKTAGSIFFSPNYADISFENIDVSVTPFLKIRLHDKTAVNRCKEITIHKLAGIPEVTQCSDAPSGESCS